MVGESQRARLYLYIYIDRRLHAHGNYKPHIHPKKESKKGPDSGSMGQTSRRGNSERGSWGYLSPLHIFLNLGGGGVTVGGYVSLRLVDFCSFFDDGQLWHDFWSS